MKHRWEISVAIRNTNVAILRGLRKIRDGDLQFAFTVLQFATRTAIDCKLRSSNCKVQIEHAVAAGPRWVSSVASAELWEIICCWVPKFKFRTF
jgi:hypothetical protein